MIFYHLEYFNCYMGWLYNIIIITIIFLHNILYLFLVVVIGPLPDLMYVGAVNKYYARFYYSCSSKNV